MTTIKNEKLEQLEKSKADYTKQLANINEILEALDKWDKKIIDKRFFEHFFTEKTEYRNYTKYSTEYRNYTKYSLVKPRYDFQEHYAEIYIGVAYGNIEVMDRTKEEIVKALTARKGSLIEILASNESLTEKVLKIDEKQIKKELIAIFKKHNCPTIWKDILESFEIKYPNEK